MSDERAKRITAAVLKVLGEGKDNLAIYETIRDALGASEPAVGESLRPRSGGAEYVCYTVMDPSWGDYTEYFDYRGVVSSDYFKDWDTLSGPSHSRWMIPGTGETED